MPRRRKRRSSTTTPRKPWLGPWIRQTTALIAKPGWHTAKRSAVGLAWLLCLAAMVIGWILGVPRLQASASQRGFVNPHDVTIRFVDPPLWMKGPLADILLRTAALQIGGDPLVRSDLIAVRQALLDTGWFDSVDQVRRVSSDLVEVQAQFVRPYALIRDGKADHLVDAAGKLLPKQYETGAPTNFIVISGAHFKRPAMGKRWEGADVAAGLKLLQLLERQPWRKQIAQVDVAGCLHDGPIKLHTDKGSVIVWGGPPGEEAALELLADGKFQRLNFLFQRYRRVDGNCTGELDITGERAVVAR